MRRVWLCFLLAISLLACGEESTVSSARLSDDAPSPSGEPLVLTEANTAIPLTPPTLRQGVYRGDLTLLSGNSALTETREATSHAVVTLQVIDEREAVSSATDAQSNPAPFQASKRLRDLFTETEDVLGDEGLDDWDEYTVVFDLFRVSGTWLVRWDGINIRDFTEEGTYGFWRDDMREEVRAVMRSALTEALGRGKPVKRVVIGEGMERLLASPGGASINPADFANFTDFYLETVEMFREEFPELAFSVGFNWDNLVTRVAALYTKDGDVSGVRFGEVRAVWRDVVAPLIEASDFIALSARPEMALFETPEDLPNSHYALLGQVQGDKPVVWHSVYWPVDTPASKSRQGEYLETFLRLNAGTDVTLISWRSLLDFPQGTAECNGIINLGGEPELCFSGLYRDSLAPSEVSELYFARP